MRAAFVLALALLVACDNASEDAHDGPPRSSSEFRVITLAPHLAELAFAVGAGESVVGVSAYTDYPPAAAALPVVSDGFSADAEAIIAARPTLVLAWAGGGQARMRELVESLGVPVEAVPGARLADIGPALRRVGALTGHADAGTAAADRFESRIEALVPAPGAPTVFYQIGTQTLYTVSDAHFIGDLIRRCGGRNVFAELAQAAPAVSVEAVLAADPAVILVGERELDDARAFWARWPGLAAVRANAVVGVPADLVARPGPRLAAGGEALCAALAAVRPADPD